MNARAATLYTPQVLAAATGLAAWPWNDALPLKGDARSRTCGSSLSIGLALDAAGRVAELGIRTHACAIGQAAAHAFASGARGRTLVEVAQGRAALGAWLAGAADLPDWPGLAVIAAARAHPSRHGAIVLAWDAALGALQG
jgi:NifU-like protein involved in Fe-S cluster formation